MKKTGFILLICIFCSGIYAQETGLPILRNYLPKEFIYSPQVFSLIQAQNGLMYFGITDYGVLEYDGVEWRGIPTSLKSEVFGLAFDKHQTLYVAATNDFGYLSLDNHGRKVYRSLKSLLPNPVMNIGNVWNVHIIENEAFFFTESCIYIYHIDSKQIRQVRPEKGKAFYVPFVFKNQYYILHASDGIFRLGQDKSLSSVPATRIFSKNIFLSVVPYDSTSVLIPTRTAGLFIVDLYGKKPPEKLQLKHTDDFIQGNNIYTAFAQGDSLFILGSMEEGAIIIDRQANILSQINEQTGLQNNLVLAAATDMNRNIWLALSIGISKAETGRDIAFWDKTKGLKGNIYDITRFNGLIYLVTNQKIYHLKPRNLNQLGADSKDYRLFEVEGLPPGQNWCLAHFNVPKQNRVILLAGTQNGIYELKGNTSKLLFRGNLHAFAITQSKKDPYRIFSTDGFNNFISLRYKGANFHPEGKWEGIDEDVREICEDSNGNLWLGTLTNGVFYIEPDTTQITRPKLVRHFGLAEGLPALNNCKPVEYRNKILVGTEKGLYVYNRQLQKFEPYITGNQEFDQGSTGVANFFEGTEGRIYLSSKNSSTGRIGFLVPANGSFHWIYKPFRRLPEMASISAVYADPDGTVWIGSNEGLFRYKPALDFKNYELDFNCLVRKVIIGNDSVIYWGNETQTTGMYTPVIDYQYNNLKFHFAAPFFDQEENIRYSCLLEGFDEDWSPWNNSTFKEYTRVREGTYTFKVKAVNIYGKESPVAHYRVQVLPPWYRTIYAYIFYGLALLVLLILSTGMYSRILVRQKRRLENTVEERTREIIQQKDAIQSQAEEMAAQSEELQEKAEILRKINEELEKLSIVARETDNAIAIMDEKGQFLWVNDGFTRLYGYSSDEYFSMYSTIYETVHSDEIVKLIKQSLETKQSVLFETRVETKKGKRLFIQSTITPITGPNGKIDKLVAIDSDITRLKEAEWEIIKKSEQITAQKEELEQHRNHLEQIVKKRTEELEIAKNKAEESDRLKSAFLANMSHEIRTPMNAIIGFSNLLISPDISGEQKEEFAQLIIQSGNSLLQLIEDIIDIAKIEAGQLKIVHGTCNLALLLAELYDFFRQRIQVVYNKDIRLSLQIPNNYKSLQIRTDQLRLKQVFTNLIENAIKFTNKGLIEYGYQVQEESGQAVIRFYVKDSGIGMSEKEQQIIFERFTKIETDRTRLYRGAGLGLAISKNIVEMLGGELKVVSEVNKGSEFYFSFPLEEGGLAENIPVRPEVSVYHWENKTILVAEDEDSNFRFIEVFLASTGVKIVRALDGRELLEKYDKENFDLLLMDIKMPLMDGLEATREIRKKNRDIPVIALTAYAMQNDEQDCLEAGCNAFISKPIDQTRMMETLGQWLNR